MNTFGLVAFSDYQISYPGWDLRAKREIAPDDTVVFAIGSFNQEPRSRSFSDLKE